MTVTSGSQCRDFSDLHNAAICSVLIKFLIPSETAFIAYDKAFKILVKYSSVIPKGRSILTKFTKEGCYGVIKMQYGVIKMFCIYFSLKNISSLRIFIL